MSEETKQQEATTDVTSVAEPKPEAASSNEKKDTASTDAPAANSVAPRTGGAPAHVVELVEDVMVAGIIEGEIKDIATHVAPAVADEAESVVVQSSIRRSSVFDASLV